MNVENFRLFLELQGRKVIESESGYWHDTGRSIYLSFPYHATIEPSKEEIEELFRKHRPLGLKYSTDKNVGRPAALYVVRDKSYGPKDLHSMAKRGLKKGLRLCRVERIDFDYLREHGMPLNLDTLKRQGRDDPLFSRPDRWARFCEAGKRVEGASAWGAFVDGQLAAYQITFIIDDYCHVLHRMSRTKFLRCHPNEALDYTVIREMISSPGINCVACGLQSILDLPGLDGYKLRMGYQKRRMNFVVVLHPLLEPLLLSRLGEGLLGVAGRLAPDNDALKRVIATVDIARWSRRTARSRDSMEEALSSAS